MMEDYPKGVIWPQRNPQGFRHGSVMDVNLEKLIQELNNLGYSSKDYKYLVFEKSYKSCWYEGDEPEVVICDTRIK